MAIQNLVDAEIFGNRIATLPPLLKSAQEAQKLLDACRESRRRTDLASGQTFSREDLRSIVAAMGRLGEIMRNMPNELGPKANPMDARFGIDACHEWHRNRFETALEKAIGEVTRLQPMEATE